MIFKHLLSMCSPGGTKAKLSILIFHRVTPRVDPLFPGEMDALQFTRVCRWVKGWFHVLPLDEAVQRLYRNDLPARALAMTFDDGYADNWSVAAPILTQLQLPCTFFVATGFLDGGCMWNDTIIEAVRRSPLQSLDLRDLGLMQSSFDLADDASRRCAIDQIIAQAKYLPHERRVPFAASLLARAEVRQPDDLMMTSRQLQQLHGAGFTIGAHTVTHPILARLGDAEARREIEDSRDRLQQLIAAPVSLFAYPNGKAGQDYAPATVRLVRDAGFDLAVSTNWGASGPESDRFQLARFTPWDRNRTRFGLRLARNAMSTRIAAIDLHGNLPV